jgi:hypothetical protein
MNIIQTIGLGTLAGTVTSVASQALASSTIPLIMSHTGTIITGVGTIHSAGGLAATLQAFAMAPVLAVAPTFVLGGAVLGASYGVYCLF